MSFHHLRLSVEFQQTVQGTHFPPPPLHLYRLQKVLLWSLVSSQKPWKPGQHSHIGGGGGTAARSEDWEAHLRCPRGHPGHPSPSWWRACCCHVTHGCGMGMPPHLQLFHRWNFVTLGKHILLSGLAFNSCVRRKLWGELFMESAISFKIIRTVKSHYYHQVLISKAKRRVVYIVLT